MRVGLAWSLAGMYSLFHVNDKELVYTGKVSFKYENVNTRICIKTVVFLMSADQSPFSLRYRSASMAAMHPEPAAVTACL